MSENEEKKVNTEELKTEASNTVNQVKDTIKKVDIKKDSMEAKGFLGDLFKNPLEKIQEIGTTEDGKFFKYAIIIIVIWMVAELIAKCFSIGNIWGFARFGKSLLSVVLGTITPIVSILVMSLIIFIMNSKNKKSLTTVMSTVTTANIPTVIASVVNLLTIISTSISVITIPFAKLCSVVSVVLMYFAIKAIFGAEKNSEFVKKFVIIESIYYVAYIVLSLLKIYI